jgi:chondroitin 4-sulfotransferase 11
MISRERRIVFCHIPKNAGTSIGWALHVAGGYIVASYPPILRDPKMTWTQGECQRTLRWVGAEVWNSSFRFAFVRNPWDRLVSGWRFTRDRGRHNLPFKEFVESLTTMTKLEPLGTRDRFEMASSIRWHTMSQCDHLLVEGKLAVDFLGKVETLEDDWHAVSGRVGCHLPLPRLNETTHGLRHGHYDDATLEAAAEIVRQDAETFGYKF